MADFLLALADFDRKRLWRELGHTSLFYYLHREPRAFDGGELRLQLPPVVPGEQPTYVDIEPEQNRLVAFPSGLVHEVRPVSVPTNRFEDRRFALSAWLRA